MLGGGLGLGDLRVQLRSNRFAAMAALGMAIALSGCADADMDTQGAWFSKPFRLASQTGGYTFSELQESKQQQRPITANDLVNSNGSCPPPAAPPAPQVQAGPGTQPIAPVAPVDTASLLGTGIALGMSECDVVFRAGQPASVQIGKNPNGDRTAALTFPAGPRAGIYHFERGALMEMDAVAPPAPVAKNAKKKSTKSAKSTKPQNQS
jgi:hypothetical protein